MLLIRIKLNGFSAAIIELVTRIKKEFSQFKIIVKLIFQ